MKKKYLYTGLFVMELVVLMYAYCYGKDGLHILSLVQKKQQFVQKKIKKIKQRIVVLQEQIEEWHTNDFYVERFAREQLQMARRGDVIYYRS